MFSLQCTQRLGFKMFQASFYIVLFAHPLLQDILLVSASNTPLNTEGIRILAEPKVPPFGGHETVRRRHHINTMALDCPWVNIRQQALFVFV